MPSTARILSALFAALLCTPLPAREASILRSDQNSVHEFSVLNEDTAPRDFVLKAEENTEESWMVVYLSGGTNITSTILSPGGVTLSVPPGPGGLAIEAAFFASGAPENSIRTTTITATPLDGRSPVQKATFHVRMLTLLVVNDDRDLSDADPLDEWLDADPVTPGEQITLRSALELSNRREGFDTIEFNIPVEANPRIVLQSPLPEITGPVLIDGHTQPTGGAPGVEITGEALPAGNTRDGLVLSGGNSILRGLALTRFRSVALGEIPDPAAPNPSGILLKGSGGNRIESCHLGLPPSGTVGAGNEGYGLRIQCPDNVIEACHAAGNWIGGIGIFGPEATGNTVAATVGGDLLSRRSSNLLGPGLAVDDLLLSPLTRASTPSFYELDKNLANSSIHFTLLNERTPWESPAAGFLGGIVLHEAPGNFLTGCRVSGNGFDGIRVIGDAAGTTLLANISGDRQASHSLRNAGHGISLECDHAVLRENETHRNLRSGVFVRGIGNEIRSLHSSGNGECGIHCEGRQTLVGGPFFSDMGQIHSNPVGIFLSAPTASASFTPGANLIHGNLIGAERPSEPGHPISRPNLRGIHIADSSNNQIGAESRSRQKNTIINNRLEGILVSSGTGNRLYGNTFSSNGRLDIDLSNGADGDGTDPVHPSGLREGGNLKLNAPRLLRAVQDGNRLQFGGTLRGLPAGSYTLELVISVPGIVPSSSQSSEIIPLNHLSELLPFAFEFPSFTNLRGAHMRVSITDSSENTSEYSPWIRIEGPEDTDGDGISDEVEALQAHTGQPGKGDTNEDGTPDAQQPHVASFPTLLSGSLTLTAAPGVSFVNTLPQSLSRLPPMTGQNFPHGTWTSQLRGLTNGEAVTISVSASNSLLGEGFYNFGPTPDNPVPHWYDFAFDGTTGARRIGERLVLRFVDGERGDHDLAVNGSITGLGGITTTLPPLPDPSFSLLPDGSVTITWPRETRDLFLQELSHPSHFSWIFTPAPILESAGARFVRLRPSHDRRLFRLVRP